MTTGITNTHVVYHKKQAKLSCMIKNSHEITSRPCFKFGKKIGTHIALLESMTKLKSSIVIHIFSYSIYLILALMSEDIYMMYQMNSMNEITVTYDVSQAILPTNLNHIKQSQDFSMKNIQVVNITMKSMHKISLGNSN